MPLGFTRHFHTCNAHDLSKFVPFKIGQKQLGWIAKDMLPLLDGVREPVVTLQAVTLSETSFDIASDILGLVVEHLCSVKNQKLRNELYPIVNEWGDAPLAQIDRVAVPWFGVRGFGIHVNGFVRKPDGIHLWIGERAADRLAEPGALDNMIGGGQPIGLTVEQNLAKEAYEEAGIDPIIAATARPVSTLRYMLEKNGGLRNDTLFVYDLELPESVMPRNTDGEVAAFHLMPLPEVAEIVRTTDRFKFNCNLVVIDFLMRHEFWPQDSEEYATIKGLIGR